MAAKAYRGRPELTIKLDGHDGSSVPSYSTLDRIEGTVSITATSTTKLDLLVIEFIGK